MTFFTLILSPSYCVYNGLIQCLCVSLRDVEKFVELALHSERLLIVVSGNNNQFFARGDISGFVNDHGEASVLQTLYMFFMEMG